MKTYRLGEENGQAYIECTRCGMRSFHTMDIEHRYCVRCHRFLEDAQASEASSGK